MDHAFSVDHLTNNRYRSHHLGTAQGVDQNTKQQIAQIIAAYHDAWNNHNAAGIAGLYMKDAILVTQVPQIVKHGQQDIEKKL